MALADAPVRWLIFAMAAPDSVFIRTSGGYCLAPRGRSDALDELGRDLDRTEAHPLVDRDHVAVGLGVLRGDQGQVAPGGLCGAEVDRLGGQAEAVSSV